MPSYHISSYWLYGGVPIDAQLDLIDLRIDTLQQIRIWSQNSIMIQASVGPTDRPQAEEAQRDNPAAPEIDVLYAKVSEAKTTASTVNISSAPRMDLASCYI